MTDCKKYLKLRPMGNVMKIKRKLKAGVLSALFSVFYVLQPQGVSAADAPTGTDLGEVNWAYYLILALIIGMIFIAGRTFVQTKKTLKEYGYFPPAHKKKNYTGVFLLMLLSAVLVLYFLVYGLTEKIGMLNTIMFAVFPYVAFAIFIKGSIQRYRDTGYKVSSLSSQFLEGRQIFWGSQPFHWGLMVLFFGHLIAFLFPSSLLLFNGSPVRLIILEVTSFVFALSVLLGLILLLKRRLSSKRLLMVSNKMDMLVYVVLLVQVISGLGVALFAGWGSSWFAGVLTPYLRSVFSFNPDISAVSAMPWIVQIHIISAFFIIAIIPFTRFMHFLVAPIDYTWRRYQVVIWNWNRKGIRNSKAHTYGHKTRNH